MTADENIFKKVNCKYCGRIFACQSYLERHLLQHTGEKPYKCDYCEKRFTRQTTVDKHVIREHGLMNWKCDKCGENFASRRAHLVHVELCYGIRVDL